VTGLSLIPAHYPKETCKATPQQPDRAGNRHGGKGDIQLVISIIRQRAKPRDGIDSFVLPVGKKLLGNARSVKIPLGVAPGAPIGIGITGAGKVPASLFNVLVKLAVLNVIVLDIEHKCPTVRGSDLQNTGIVKCTEHVRLISRAVPAVSECVGL